jgi:hypothetical protein
MQQKHEFYEVAAYCMANGESCPMSDTLLSRFFWSIRSRRPASCRRVNNGGEKTCVWNLKMRGACDAIVIGWIKASSRHSEKLPWEMEHQSHRRRRIEIRSTRNRYHQFPPRGRRYSEATNSFSPMITQMSTTRKFRAIKHSGKKSYFPSILGGINTR